MAAVIKLVATTRPEYEQVMEVLDLDADPPKGLIAHAACEVDGIVEVTDIWEDAADFELFAETRLGKALAEVGATPKGAPEVVPAFNVYTP